VVSLGRLARVTGALAALIGGAFAGSARADALPIFAHRYGFSCQACHTIVPHLNAFGRAFFDHGYRIQGLEARPDFPIAVRTNLLYSSNPDPGLPKTIVDEVEGFLGGTAGRHVSYFVEQYFVNGGLPGTTRDAWVAYRPQPFAPRPLVATAGQFTLPLPVDPETFRDTAAHYLVYDQTVGENPFKFFDDKIGASVAYGNPTRGTSGTLAVLQGHDTQSGIPRDGLDAMVDLQHVAGPLSLSAYRYSGSRPLPPVSDQFWRLGFGLTAARGPATFDLVLQNGNDSSYLGLGKPASSSGGFAQLRYDLTETTFAIARLDGTNDPAGFKRTAVFLYGLRFTANTRFTVEDDLSHTPQTQNVLQVQLTVAY
jgi:hypothetical protein